MGPPDVWGSGSDSSVVLCSRRLAQAHSHGFQESQRKLLDLRRQAELHFCFILLVRARGVFRQPGLEVEKSRGHPMLGAASGRRDRRRGGGRHHALHASPLTRESYREESFGRLWEVWSRAGESSVSKNTLWVKRTPGGERIPSDSFLS